VARFEFRTHSVGTIPRIDSFLALFAPQLANANGMRRRWLFRNQGL